RLPPRRARARPSRRGEGRRRLDEACAPPRVRARPSGAGRVAPGQDPVLRAAGRVVDGPAARADIRSVRLRSVRRTRGRRCRGASWPSGSRRARRSGGRSDLAASVPRALVSRLRGLAPHQGRAARRRPVTRLLVVSYHFPPAAGVAAARVGKLVKYLARLGWEPRVVAASPRPDALLDDDLAADVAGIERV